MSTSKEIFFKSKSADDGARRINRLLHPRKKEQKYNTYFTNQKDRRHLAHRPISPAHMSAAALDIADMLAAGMIAGMIVVVAGIVVVAVSIPVDATSSLDILDEDALGMMLEGSLDELVVRQNDIADERNVRGH